MERFFHKPNKILLVLLMLTLFGCPNQPDEPSEGVINTINSNTSANSNTPAQPSDFTAVAESESSISLSWTDNSDDESGFIITRKLLGTDTYDQIASLASDTVIYTDSGLLPDTTYHYRLKAFGLGGNSAESEASAATFEAAATVPSAPSGLSASATGTSSISLSWADNSSNESGFKIERSSTSGTTGFSQITSVGANITTYSNTSLSANTQYWYRIRAYNSAGDSGYSNVASDTTDSAVTVPSAPSGLNASATGTSSISLSWADNSSNESGFKIERSSTSGTTGFSQITSVGANITTYSNTSLSANTQYWYRIRAYNSAGDSGYSNVASDTTDSAVTIPSAPSGLSASATGTSSISLSWADNSSNESGFEIERSSTSGTTGFSQITSVGANITTYSNTSLSANTQYWYRIRAYNSAGDSGYSNVASDTTDSAVTVPSAPSGAAADATNPSSMRITWSDNSSNETGFIIRRQHPSISNSWQTVTTVSANATSYTHTGVYDYTHLGYRVAATNSAGTSSYTGTVYSAPKLRIYNDLYHYVSSNDIDWGKLNNIVRVRIATTESAVLNDSNNTYEELCPFDSLPVGYESYMNYIQPYYNSTTYYEDFSVSHVDPNYWLFVQTGWWEYFYDTFSGTSSWIKRVSEVLCNDGTCCCYKWVTISVTDHSHGWVVISIDDFLPDGSWNGTL